MHSLYISAHTFCTTCAGSALAATQSGAAMANAYNATICTPGCQGLPRSKLSPDVSQEADNYMATCTGAPVAAPWLRRRWARESALDCSGAFITLLRGKERHVLLFLALSDALSQCCASVKSLQRFCALQERCERLAFHEAQLALCVVMPSEKTVSVLMADHAIRGTKAPAAGAALTHRNYVWV